MCVGVCMGGPDMRGSPPVVRVEVCVCGGLHGWPRHDGQSPSSQGGGVCVGGFAWVAQT